MIERPQGQRVCRARRPTGIQNPWGQRDRGSPVNIYLSQKHQKHAKHPSFQNCPFPLFPLTLPYMYLLAQIISTPQPKLLLPDTPQVCTQVPSSPSLTELSCLIISASQAFYDFSIRALDLTQQAEDTSQVFVRVGGGGGGRGTVSLPHSEHIFTCTLKRTACAKTDAEYPCNRKDKTKEPSPLRYLVMLSSTAKTFSLIHSMGYRDLIQTLGKWYSRSPVKL